jgi:hypothetical protein
MMIFGLELLISESWSIDVQNAKSTFSLTHEKFLFFESASREISSDQVVVVVEKVWRTEERRYPDGCWSEEGGVDVGEETTRARIFNCGVFNRGTFHATSTLILIITRLRRR